jgi:hypothetical protein
MVRFVPQADIKFDSNGIVATTPGTVRLLIERHASVTLERSQQRLDAEVL